MNAKWKVTPQTLARTTDNAGPGAYGCGGPHAPVDLWTPSGPVDVVERHELAAAGGAWRPAAHELRRDVARRVCERVAQVARVALGEVRDLDDGLGHGQNRATRWGRATR